MPAGTVGFQKQQRGSRTKYYTDECNDALFSFRIFSEYALLNLRNKRAIDKDIFSFFSLFSLLFFCSIVRKLQRNPRNDRIFEQKGTRAYKKVRCWMIQYTVNGGKKREIQK